MKTKTLALSLVLYFFGFTVMAQTDSIPKKDTIPSNDTTKISNSTVFNFSFVPQKDTIPKTDSVPKKDSSMVFNWRTSQINFYSEMDTVPSSDTTKKDTSMAFIFRQLILPRPGYLIKTGQRGISFKNESSAWIRRETIV